MDEFAITQARLNLLQLNAGRLNLVWLDVAVDVPEDRTGNVPYERRLGFVGFEMRCGNVPYVRREFFIPYEERVFPPPLLPHRKTEVP